nr:hypothetical protein [Sebaldella termitidis]
MKKKVKVNRREETHEVETIEEKYNITEIFLFYLLPLIIVLLNFFCGGIVLKNNEISESLGNIGTIVSIFSGFLFNAILSVQQRPEKTYAKDVYYNINYSLLVSFVLLTLITIGFYKYNLILENIIFFFLIHFVFSILLVFNLIFSLEKP